jgi:tetratricopeptide (TPR) repeat protein
MNAIGRSLAVMLAMSALAIGAWSTDSPTTDLTSGKMDDAIRSLNAQISANAKDAEAYNLLNRVYFNLEDYDAAIKNGEKAVELKPNDAIYRLWLGKAYGEKADKVGPFNAMGLAKKAAAEFEKVVQLDPKDRRGWMALAEFYVEAPGIMGGGKDKARKLAQQVEATDPAVAAWIRGLTANKEKNWAEAESQFKGAVKASGGAAWTYLELAHYYGWGKRWDDFESAINSAMNSPKKSPADVYNAADLLIGRGRNFAGAAQILKNYIATGKKDEDGPSFRAHFLLGQLYEKQGNKPGAIEEYRASLSLAQNFRAAQEALKRLGA